MTLVDFRSCKLVCVACLSLAAWPGCSSDQSSPAASGGTSPAPAGCGELTPELARTTAIERLLSLHSALLEAWPAVGNSRLLPRLLAMGSGQSLAIATEVGDVIARERELLEQHWFADTNLETALGSEVVFRLQPTTFCTAILDDCLLDPTSSSAEGGASGAPPSGSCTQTDFLDRYQRCLERLSEHAVRLSVTPVACESGPHVRVSLMAGEQRVVPLTLELYGEHAVIKIDAARVAAAAPLISDPADNCIVYSGSRGQVQTEIRMLAPGQVTLRVDLLEALDFSGSIAGEPYGLSLAAGEHVLELALDAHADSDAKPSAALQFELGSVNVMAALDRVVSGWFGGTVSDPARQHHPVRVELPGITGELDYYGTRDRLTTGGLGLGASSSRLVYRADTLLGLDLDPQGDHRLAFDISASSSDELLTTLRPDLVLTLSYALDKLAPYASGLPSYAANNTLGIRLAGPTESSARLWLDASGQLALLGSESGPLLSVLTGELTLTTESAPETLSVGAGECLWRATGQSGSSGLLSGLSAAPCP